MKVGTFDAKTHLSELLERVRQGERITITRRGVPIAVLVPPSVQQEHTVREVADELAAIRSRSREGAETLRELRDTGRNR